jgi:hypothetical protein
MPNKAELARALHAAWRLARLDRGGLLEFDLSHHGVWRSFWAAAICYPGFLVLLFARLDADTIAQSGFLHIAIVESIGFVAAWSAFPLIVLAYCKWIGREDRGFEFIVAYNWSQVLQTALLLLAAIGNATIFPDQVGPDVDLVAYVAALGYEWFIALVAIGAGGWIATSIVFFDLALGAILSALAQSLY